MPAFLYQLAVGVCSMPPSRKVRGRFQGVCVQPWGVLTSWGNVVSKHLLSRSAALIRCCGFRSLKLSQAKIEIWFADVFWLTPAGMCAVAGRGSSLVYPYKLQYVCFCCSQTQGKMRVYSSQYLPSPSYPSIVACCCRPLRLWLTHLPHRPTLEPPRRGPRARSSPPRQVAFSSTSDRSPSWRARATNASGAGTISTGC